MNGVDEGLKVNLHQLLRAMIEKGASDTHIATGSPRCCASMAPSCRSSSRRYPQSRPNSSATRLTEKNLFDLSRSAPDQFASFIVTADDEFSARHGPSSAAQRITPVWQRNRYFETGRPWATLFLMSERWMRRRPAKF